VLTVDAPAKSNRVKGSPKVARHTAAIIAGTLVRLLQASVNADTPVASRTNTDGGSSAAIRPLNKSEIPSPCAGPFNSDGSRASRKTTG